MTVVGKLKWAVFGPGLLVQWALGWAGSGLVHGLGSIFSWRVFARGMAPSGRVLIQCA